MAYVWAPPASGGPPSRSPLVLLVVRVGGDVIVVQLPPDHGRLRGMLPLAGGAAAGAGQAAPRSRTASLGLIASVHRPHARVFSGGRRPGGPVGLGTLLKASWAASGFTGGVFSIQQTARPLFENPPGSFHLRRWWGEGGLGDVVTGLRPPDQGGRARRPSAPCVGSFLHKGGSCAPRVLHTTGRF